MKISKQSLEQCSSREDYIAAAQSITVNKDYIGRICKKCGSVYVNQYSTTSLCLVTDGCINCPEDYIDDGLSNFMGIGLRKV